MLLHNETKRQLAAGAGRGDQGGQPHGYRLARQPLRRGQLGEPAALLGCREIATGYGYASGQPAYAHFGLGKAEKVDVEVILPHGKGKLTHKGVTVNQTLKVKQ
jgi:ASPIC and UnbV.